jgi:hypothetical protein
MVTGAVGAGVATAASGTGVDGADSCAQTTVERPEAAPRTIIRVAVCMAFIA